MKKQSRAVPRRRQSVSPTPRHLPALLHESELARTDPDSTVIEDVAREDDLSPPPCGTARSKAVSDDRRVPEERVLHASLPMVARRLLPASSPISLTATMSGRGHE